jgi:hypothetical protein
VILLFEDRVIVAFGGTVSDALTTLGIPKVLKYLTVVIPAPEKFSMEGDFEGSVSIMI